MGRSTQLFFIVTASLLAGSAHAAVTVMGGGPGAVCSTAAFAGDASDASLLACDQAVMEAVPEYKAGAHVNRGILLLRRRQFEAARADFQEAERLKPGFGEAIVNRGAAFIAERRYMEGLIEIDRGLALGPEEPEKAYYNRAIANEGLDDKEAAYLDYRKALELSPQWQAPLQQLQRLSKVVAPMGAHLFTLPPQSPGTRP